MRAVSLALVVFWLRAAAAYEPQPELIHDGRSYVAWLYVGAYDRLLPHLHPRLLARFPDKAALAAERRRLLAPLGEETSLESERVERTAEGKTYVRVARYKRQESPWEVRIGIDSTGAIHGITVTPRAAPTVSPYADRETHARLRLPVGGVWTVAAGGRTIAVNAHAATPDQRFAIDLVKTSGGVDHKKGERGNLAYFGFGQPVLAPADGVVVSTVRELPDNPPGEGYDESVLGNHVVIDLGDGEFAVLAHLQEGSVSVARGEKVRAGDPIGRCGNSGRSQKPHVHLHLQDRAEPGGAEGMPMQLEGYIADGTDVPRGEPKKGQILANQPSQGDRNATK
jgi:murein DD-endopeptidase MepM/ murein hydrolase activator NlpD